MAWVYFALMPTLPVYFINNLQISYRNVGLIMAAFSIAATLARPISGYLIDNFHRSGVLIVSLFLITVVCGIYPLLGTVSTLFLLRFMHGAMWGIANTSSAPIVADIVPPSRMGQGIGIWAVTIPIGMTIGPMFGLGLLNARGPNVMFLAVVGVSVLSVVGAFLARTPSKPVARRTFSVSSLFHAKALPVSYGMFFLMIAFGAIMIFVGIYATQKGFSNVGGFFLCFAVAMFLSRLLSGRSFDKGHVFPLILIGLALTAVGVLLLGYASAPMLFLAAGIANGAGFGILMPTCQSAVNSLVKPNERGAANSTYLISYDLGIGAGALIIGSLSDKVPLEVIYRYSIFLILLSAGILVFKAIPHYRRERQGDGAIP